MNFDPRRDTGDEHLAKLIADVGNRPLRVFQFKDLFSKPEQMVFYVEHVIRDSTRIEYKDVVQMSTSARHTVTNGLVHNFKAHLAMRSIAGQTIWANIGQSSMISDPTAAQNAWTELTKVVHELVMPHLVENLMNFVRDGHEVTAGPFQLSQAGVSWSYTRWFKRVRAPLVPWSEVLTLDFGFVRSGTELRVLRHSSCVREKSWARSPDTQRVVDERWYETVSVAEANTNCMALQALAFACKAAYSPGSTYRFPSGACVVT